MRAAVYVRQSLDREGDRLAVSRQREDCEALVAARGWSLAGVYEDNDASASTRKPRPAYRRLLADLEAEKVDAVVAWATDRLHRKLSDLVEFVDIVKATGATVATVKSGDLDLSTPHGRMLAGILGSVAQAEVEQKGERHRRANRQRAETGAPRFGRRPFGYTADGRRTVPAEARVIRQAATDALAGASLADVARRLNAKGPTTVLGKPWQVTSVRHVLLNPRHAALNTYRGEVVGKGDWPAILTEETHHALVSLLGDPQRRTAASTARKYLLSGLAVCGQCGGRMFGTPSGFGDRMIYRCVNQDLSRGLDLVDDVVVRTVVQILSRPDAVDLLIDRSRDDLEDLRDQAMNLRQRLDEAARLFADGSISASQLATITDAVQRDLTDVETRQAEAGRVSVLGDLVTAKDVRRKWDGLPLSRRRAVVDLLMTVTIEPAGKGVRFDPEQVRMTPR